MTGFGKPGKWQKAMLVATGVGVLGASLAAPLADAATLAPVARQAEFRLQNDAQAEPSQVGESDDESLDQGAPPAASEDDPENLDQGAPPTTSVPVPVAEGTVLTTTPVATDTAYAEPAGPRLPPGFGEGRVLVSNNSRGFPVGLEPCEVGVVTGRAYVGVKCGEDGSPVVGHSTYEDFPWVIDPGFPFEPGADVVTDPSFPFDEDSPFFESFLDRTNDSDVVVLVAPRGFPFDDDDADDASSDRPTVTTRGVVSLAQPARTDKERNGERTRSNRSASSGDVSSNPGKSHTRRSASEKQKATVSADSRRSKNSNENQGKAKVKKNKKKDNKRAGKESKKQRAKKEKREKRNKDR